jgi:hypothetical protein
LPQPPLVRVAKLLPSPLQFWEKTIPETDRSSHISLISFVSNHVMQELRPPTEGGTPLGYLTGMITENRRAWPLAAVAAQPVWRFLILA